MTFSARRFATLRRVCDSLLVALILVVLFGVVLGRLVPLTGRTTLVIGGGSMEPALPLGAAVVVDPIRPGSIAVGDIVSLRTGSRLQSIFTHRVTRIVTRDDGLWIETKGDANATVDPSLTPAHNVIGRVSMSIASAGFLIALLSIPSGVLLVILLAAVLLTMTWLIESYEVDLVARAPARETAETPAPTSRAEPTGRHGSARSARAGRLRHAREAAADPGD